MSRLDQFYTRSDLAGACVEMLRQHLAGEVYPCDLDAFAVIEPSAGTGSFLIHLPPTTVALDLDPKAEGIIKQDFLGWRRIYLHRNVAIVGNPPFGKNSSTALAFFNNAAQTAHLIAMILPRTFRKASVQNRLDDRFHLVAERLTPAGSFIHNDLPYDVPCVFQIWQRSLRQRDRRTITALPRHHRDFSFVERDRATIAIQRIGANAGRVKDSFDSCAASSHYFIKPHAERAIPTLRKIDFDTVRHDTAGNPSIGKAELIELYTTSLGSAHD